MKALRSPLLELDGDAEFATASLPHSWWLAMLSAVLWCISEDLAEAGTAWNPEEQESRTEDATELLHKAVPVLLRGAKVSGLPYYDEPTDELLEEMREMVEALWKRYPPPEEVVDMAVATVQPGFLTLAE